MDLMKYFEMVSGSYPLRLEYEEMHKQLVETDVKRNEIAADIKSLNATKLRCDKNIANGSEYNKISEEFESISLDRTLAQLLECEIKINNYTVKKVKLKQDIQSLEKNSDKVTKDLRENLNSSVQEANNISQKLKHEQKLRELGNKVQHRNKIIDRKEQLLLSMRSLEQRNYLLEQNIEKDKTEKKEIEQTIQNLEKKMKEAQSLSSIEEKHRSLAKEFLQKFTANSDYSEQEIQSNIANLEGQKSKKMEEAEQLSQTIEDLSTDVVTNQRMAEAKQKELTGIELRLKVLDDSLTKLQDKHQDLGKKKEEVEQMRLEQSELNTLIERLRIKLNDKNGDSELVSYLKNKVKGFRGRFGDLFIPLDQRFQLPLRVLLGKTMDFYVVDDNETAKLVNDLLKERFTRKTLIVLKNVPKIPSKNIQKQRGDVQGSATLAYDIVNVKDEHGFIQDALRYFLMNKFCSETLAQARQAKSKLGNSGKFSFATISGEKLSGNLVTSVGNTESYFEEKKSNSEMEQKITKLEQRINELDKQIMSILSKDEENEMNGLEKRHQELLLMKNRVQTLIDMHNSEKNKSQVRLLEMEERVKVLRVEQEKIDKEIVPKMKIYTDLKTKRLNNLESQLEEYLSKNGLSKKEVGHISAKLRDILDFFLQSSFDFNNKLALLQKKIVQLNIDQKQEAIVAGEKNITEIKNEIEKFEAEQRQAKLEIDLIRDDTEKMRLQIDKENDQHASKLKDQTQLRRILRQIGEEIDNARVRLREVTTDLDQFIRLKGSILEEKDMEGIEIPFLQDSKIDYTLLEQRVRIGKYNVALEKLEDMDENDTFLENLSVKDAQTLRGMLDERFKVSQEHMNSYCTKFLSDQYLSKEKNALVDITEKIKSLREQLKDLKSTSDNLRLELSDIKRRRNHKLIDLQIKVASKIDEIYRGLLGSTASAKLFLENETDATAGGIVYIPKPPNKKHSYDPLNLSGGEKSMASIALYLAINLSIGAPLLMLDEADSAFDAQNSFIYSNFIKKFASRRQVMIITHKFQIFSECEMLLGIKINKIAEDGFREADCFSMLMAAD